MASSEWIRDFSDVRSIYNISSNGRAFLVYQSS